MKNARTRRLQSLLATLACLLPMLALNSVIAQVKPVPQLPAPQATTGTTIDEKAHKSEAMSPTDVLDDCAAAIAGGDFARYADHLTAEEQSMQAGFVVAMLTMMLQVEALGANEEDPEMILVTRAMDDLLRKHARSAEAYQQTRVDSAEAQQQLMGQLMLASMMSSGEVTPSNVAIPGLMGGDIKGASLKAAELLRTPRDFLVDALSELTQPMTITRNGTTKTKTALELADLMDRYQSAEWTLYSRGSYAVAVAEFPTVEAKDVADASTAQTPEEEATATLVEFRKIDGQWKISRLLPNDMIQGRGIASVSAGEPAATLATPVPSAGSAFLQSGYIESDQVQYYAPSPSYPVTEPAAAPLPLLPPTSQAVNPSVPTPIGLPGPPLLPR